MAKSQLQAPIISAGQSSSTDRRRSIMTGRRREGANRFLVHGRVRLGVFSSASQQLHSSNYSAIVLRSWKISRGRRSTVGPTSVRTRTRPHVFAHRCIPRTRIGATRRSRPSASRKYLWRLIAGRGRGLLIT